MGKKARIRCCADGGANQLFKAFENDQDQKAAFIPDLLVGDFDSVDLKVKEYYSKMVLYLLGLLPKTRLVLSLCNVMHRDRE
jgi:thiamine pyrophosphokinase